MSPATPAINRPGDPGEPNSPTGRHRIAILVYDLRASGVVRNILRIAGAASAAGLDVSLWPIRPQGDLLDSVPGQVPVLPIHRGTTSRQRDLDSLLSVPELARAIHARRPDILFSGGNHTHLHAALALKPSGRRNTRLLGRASNAVVAAGAGNFLARSVVRPFERFQYRAMDRIVAVSRELAEALAGTLGIDGESIVTVPNGIDVARAESLAAAPIEHPFFLPGAPPVVLGVGRLSRQKNFEGLVRAFARARRCQPMRLLIVGPGSDRRRRRLRRLASKLGVEADLALEGFVPNPLPFFAKADLFVLNSRWEGASNVLLEALACGCPVVATRAPTGIAEVLLDGRLGPLVPVADDDALAEAILSRLEQPRDSDALRARAAEFDLGHTLAAYVNVFRSALQHDSSRPHARHICASDE